MTYTVETHRKLPRSLKRVLDQHHDRISKSIARGVGDDCIAVDYDSGFATPNSCAWDILLAPGWRTPDGGHRQIIESNASVAAVLIRDAERCDCADCARELNG